MQLEGMRALKREPDDLIMMNIRMPKMAGQEVTRAIRNPVLIPASQDYSHHGLCFFRMSKKSAPSRDG